MTLETVNQRYFLMIQTDQHQNIFRAKLLIETPRILSNVTGIRKKNNLQMLRFKVIILSIAGDILDENINIQTCNYVMK